MKKKTLLGAGSVLLVLAIGIYFYLEKTRELTLSQSFQYGSKKILEKTDKLIEQAKTYDQEAILNNLGKNKKNGFYFRFDDNLELVNIINSTAKSTSLSDVPKIIKFGGGNKKNMNQLICINNKCQIKNEILRIQQVEKGFLENKQSLNIDEKSVGEIEVRMKAKRAKVSRITFWGIETASLYHTNQDIGGMVPQFDIDIIPDDKFHIYRINAANLFATAASKITKIIWVPSDVKGDTIEIDYLKLIPKLTEYRQKDFDITYEQINNEYRKVIYVNPPLTLSYSLQLPKDNVYLSFGLGLLEPQKSIDFKVLLKHANTIKKIFNYKMFDNTAWKDIKIDLSEWSNQKVDILFEVNGNGNIAFWSNPLVFSKPKERFNVIIVLEDSLRADHLSCYGYFRNTSPIKDALVKKGVLFSNAYSQATYTRPSCSSFMTSLYPTATGVWNFANMLSEKYITLAEVLRSQGYSTASFIQNPSAGPSAGLQQGFSRLFNRPGDIYNNLLWNWLAENQDRNFFIYLHLIDPHFPFDPPPPFRSWYQQIAPGKMPVKKRLDFDPLWVDDPTVEGRIALYDGEISYNDYLFGKLINALTYYKLLKNTLIIVIGDHGEFLDDFNMWSHHPPGYIQVLHIPLIMAYPGKIPSGLIIDQPVQLLDIMPTILDFADIDSKKLLLQGDSLLSLIQDKEKFFWNNRVGLSDEVKYRSKEEPYNWGSIFFRDWHLIHSDSFPDKDFNREKDLADNRMVGTKAFYDAVDKQEKYEMNFFFETEISTKEFVDFINAIQDKNKTIHNIIIGDEEEPIKYDPEARERLKALGYVQ
ncbi:MAG: sulfatase [Pseudomonadota bacterium]